MGIGAVWGPVRSPEVIRTQAGGATAGLACGDRAERAERHRKAAACAAVTAA